MSAAAPRIDVGDLDFLLDRVVCTAHSGNGGLSLVLAIRAADPDAAHEAGLTSEYNRGASGGVLTFQFEGRGVYGPAGVPAGQFSIAKGRAQRRHARFHVQGTDYSLDFEGTVGFAEEHAIIRGQFRRFYGLAAPSFDVDIDMPVDVDAIDWTGYVFSTLGEIALAPPDAVRRVVLSSPEFTCLPAEVTRLHALTALTIENPEAYRTTLRLRDLTPEIGQLRALKRLAVNGAALDSLPAEIGQLEALEHLSISLCTGVEIPAEVWRLPRLTHLFLSRNQLTSVPNDIHLPALKSLDLSDNALRAIPAQVARLPSLHRLVIHGNPLESLTGELRDLPKLGLSIEERQRLLPMPYPGAEQGYPEAAYRIAAWPERVVRLDAVLEQAGPDIDPRVKPFLLATARPSVGFRKTDGDPTEKLGCTRFGGMPDLPSDWTYPRLPSAEDGQEGSVYEFIAQVDCQALADLQAYLPRTGMLYVFLSTMHDLYGHDAAYAPLIVLYYDGPRDALRPGSRFSFTADDYYEMVDSAYAPMAVDAVAAVSLPPSYPLRSNTYHFREALPTAGDDVNAFVDAYQGIDEGVDEHADEQAFDHELGGYGFSQHELPETEVALAAGGDPEDWFTLLTVKSRGGMQWGDAGDLYVMIHKADLARADFSRVKAAMYSS